MNDESSGGVLLLCYGNPVREDDGLGPELARRIERLSLAGVNVESDYQLCVEDAVDIAAASLVVFVDAAITGGEPFSFEPVMPRSGEELMSHSIAPEALLLLAREVLGRCPEAYLLGIRGYSFDMFKEGLTTQASRNLEKAADFLIPFLRSRGASNGSERASDRQTGAEECAPQLQVKALGG